MKIHGNLIDIHEREIFPATIIIKKGRIQSIKREQGRFYDCYIMPGLIDSHIHIESSMLTPGSFAKAAVPHGTIGVVSDPHEIGNVLGTPGVVAMIEDGKRVPFRFYFGAPSCVPATDFETAGSRIDLNETETLLAREDILFLAEMMNFPGVVNGESIVMEKINIAKKYNKKIDGHAPGLTGEMLKRYADAGISTDHECSTMKEALEKIGLGMKILIREGSAARNLESLKGLYIGNSENVMLCSDDLHPEMLIERHLEKIIANLISEGFDIFDVIRSATLNPVNHYGLDAGLLRPGDKADFIIISNPEEMKVLQTWIEGRKVFDMGKVLFSYDGAIPVNRFNCTTISVKDIETITRNGKCRIIQAFDGELITRELIHEVSFMKGDKPRTDNDILKIVVKDRYNDTPPAVGYIKGFGLKSGAIASSVAHDSHNIICVGTTDEDIVNAVNEVVKMRGGLSVSDGKKTNSLQLAMAGIMSGEPCSVIASKYQALSGLARNLGTSLSAPFMTLSFMALLVIPEIKISDKGLFDGRKFCHVPLFVD